MIGGPQRVAHQGRLARYRAVAAAVASRSDTELARLLDQAAPLGAGIGGSSARAEIDGIPIFAKRIPLTDLERRPENVRSTANLFRLPAFYHYGVGSAGFGVWRELAVHELTTAWVLAGSVAGFPLLYHWRVLPGAPVPPGDAPDYEKLPGAVAYWEGSAAVAERLDAIELASASVVLFSEYLPQNLTDWLSAESDLDDVAARLDETVSFMNAGGLLHFDAHFGNVLTDGNGFYLADYGLALSPEFRLDEAEAAFLRENLSHDRCYGVAQVVNWAKRMDVPAAVTQYAPVAAVMNEFYRKLHFESRATPYPVEELRAACAATGFPAPFAPPRPPDRGTDDVRNVQDRAGGGSLPSPS